MIDLRQKAHFIGHNLIAGKNYVAIDNEKSITGLSQKQIKIDFKGRAAV